MQIEHLKINFDAACHNRAGFMNPMGIGLLIDINKGEKVVEVCFNGGWGTSNIGEWIGCITALEFVKRIIVCNDKKDPKIDIFSDSQLVVNQYNGDWLCKHDNLKPLLKTALLYKNGIPQHSVVWVRREFNQEADVLSKKGLDSDYVKLDDIQKYVNGICSENSL
jgi:ribonuclease HI